MWHTAYLVMLLSLSVNVKTNNEFITCFHESWIYICIIFFYEILNFIFEKAAKCHFLSQIFISIEKFYLVEKQKNFFRRFRICENMWWAWPNVDDSLSSSNSSMPSLLMILHPSGWQKLAIFLGRGTEKINKKVFE